MRAPGSILARLCFWLAVISVAPSCSKSSIAAKSKSGAPEAAGPYSQKKFAAGEAAAWSPGAALAGFELAFPAGALTTPVVITATLLGTPAAPVLRLESTPPVVIPGMTVRPPTALTASLGAASASAIFFLSKDGAEVQLARTAVPDGLTLALPYFGEIRAAVPAPLPELTDLSLAFAPPAVIDTSSDVIFTFTTTHPGTFALSVEGAAVASGAASSGANEVAVSSSLFPSRDFTAVLRLDVTDAQGRSVTVEREVALDHSPPAVTLSTVPALLQGGTALTVEWTAIDVFPTSPPSSILEYFDGQWHTIVTSEDPVAAVNWTVPPITGSMRLRVSTTDASGKTASLESSVIVVDSTPPAPPQASFVAPRELTRLTESPNLALTLATCADAAQMLLSESTSAPAEGWQACSTDPGALTAVLAPAPAGWRELRIFLRDLVGNVSAGGPVTVFFEPSDADVHVFGQPTQYSVATFGAEMRGDTYHAPVSFVKISGLWVVSDYINKRVLIYNGAMGTDDYLQIGGKRAPFEPVSAGVIGRPAQVASNGQNLIVVDQDHARVLIWNQLPTRSFQPADLVIGQSSFSGYTPWAGGPGPSAASFYEPFGAVMVGKKLAISDFTHDAGSGRVTVFNHLPTANGASADTVLGQPSMTSYVPQPLSAGQISLPAQLDSDGLRLSVPSSYPMRVTIFNSLPNALPPGSSAQVVLGQTSFMSSDYGLTRSSFFRPMHAAFAGDRIYVSDWPGSRLMYWSDETSEGSAGDAAGVVGQADFVTNPGGYSQSLLGDAFFSRYDPDDDETYVANRNASRIAVYAGRPDSGASIKRIIGQPNHTAVMPNRRNAGTPGGLVEAFGVWATDTRLLVSDGAAGRVLVYDRALPSVDPLAVIGKADSSDTCLLRACTPSATVMTSPRGITMDGSGKLYIADSAANRVLVYDGVPTVTGAAAALVLGQSDFAGSAANAGALSETSLSSPSSLAVANGMLWVADSGNHRILGFPLPIVANRPQATIVLGQSGFTTASSATTATTLSHPTAIRAASGRLWVVDAGNARVLGYALAAASGDAAEIVLGQADFTSGLGNVAKGRFSTNMSDALWVVDGDLLVGDAGNSRMTGYQLAAVVSGQAPTWTISGRARPRAFAASAGADPWFYVAEDGHVGTNRVIGVKKTKLATMRDP